MVAAAGGVAAAGAEAAGGAGGAAVSFGAVGKTKLRLLHRAPLALREQARPRKPLHTQCEVRRGLGRGREARGLGLLFFLLRNY